MHLPEGGTGTGPGVLCVDVKLVELIWLGQRIAEVGRQQLQVSAPDVPTAELVVMYDLIDNTPSSIKDIARRTGYAQSRISVAVASLAEKAWIQIEADPSDARRTIAVIPEQARASYLAFQQVAEDKLADALLDGVPADRRPGLMTALEELLVVLRSRTGVPPSGI